MDKTFWMVMVDGEGVSKKMFVYESVAVDEAKRLTEETGKPSYVLKAVRRFELQHPPVVETPLEDAP